MEPPYNKMFYFEVWSSSPLATFKGPSEQLWASNVLYMQPR